jgi:hypothetical protein
MRSKNEERMFVQLGKTLVTGKIGKMERYSLDEFVEYVFPDVEFLDLPKISVFDKLFKTRKYETYAKLVLNNVFVEEIRYYRQRLKNVIIGLIKQDNYGRGKKK